MNILQFIFHTIIEEEQITEYIYELQVFWDLVWLTVKYLGNLLFSNVNNFNCQMVEPTYFLCPGIFTSTIRGFANINKE